MGGCYGEERGGAWVPVCTQLPQDRAPPHTNANAWMSHGPPEPPAAILQRGQSAGAVAENAWALVKLTACRSPRQVLSTLSCCTLLTGKGPTCVQVPIPPCHPTLITDEKGTSPCRLWRGQGLP